MTDKNYAFQGFDKDLMARAMGRDLSISSKQAIEICSYLRNKPLARAKVILQNVIVKKEAIPFRRFTNAVGHRKGPLGAGRYPMKASKAILALLESAETNAQTKGLNTGQLEIVHICAHRAHAPVHYGRQRGRQFKRSHVEVVVKESGAKKKALKKDEKRSVEPKSEIKKESKPDHKTESKPDHKTESKTVPKTESTPESKPDLKKDSKAESKQAQDKESQSKPEEKPAQAEKAEEK